MEKLHKLMLLSADNFKITVYLNIWEIYFYLNPITDGKLAVSMIGVGKWIDLDDNDGNALFKTLRLGELIKSIPKSYYGCPIEFSLFYLNDREWQVAYNIIERALHRSL